MSTSAQTPPTTFLTQEAYDRLSAELAHLSGEGRRELARRIEAAREEGDLKENGGYHAAKEEQGKAEARIRELEALLKRSEVGTAPAAGGTVVPGMVVTVDVDGDEEIFLLGSREVSAGDVGRHQPGQPDGSGGQRARGRGRGHLHHAVRPGAAGRRPQRGALPRLSLSRAAGRSAGGDGPGPGASPATAPGIARPCARR